MILVFSKNFRLKISYLELDTEKRCFICNIDKYTFEKAGINFEKHRNEEHSIWKYVDFLVFMGQKTKKDCNGVEDVIYNKIHSNKIDWFPRGKSYSLSKISYKSRVLKFLRLEG